MSTAKTQITKHLLPLFVRNVFASHSRDITISREDSASHTPITGQLPLPSATAYVSRPTGAPVEMRAKIVSFQSTSPTGDCSALIRRRSPNPMARERERLEGLPVIPGERKPAKRVIRSVHIGSVGRSGRWTGDADIIILPSFASSIRLSMPRYESPLILNENNNTYITSHQSCLPETRGRVVVKAIAGRRS